MNRTRDIIRIRPDGADAGIKGEVPEAGVPHAHRIPAWHHQDKQTFTPSGIS